MNLALRVGGEQVQAGGGGFAGQARPDGSTCPVEVRRVVEEVEVPVSRQQRCLQFEGKLPRVSAGPQFFSVLGLLGCVLESVHPLVLALGYAVADETRCLAVELGHGGGEEASSGEHGALEVGEERLAQRVRALDALSPGA